MSPALDPYSPPALPPGPPRRLHGREPRGLALKWLLLVAVLGRLALAVAAAAAPGSAGPEATGAMGGVLLVVSFVLIAMWTHAAWSDTPSEERGDTTPRRAVLGFLLPVFTLYWVFAVNTRLCDLLDRQLAAHGSPKRAPVGAALAAGIGYVVLTTCQIVGMDVASAFVFACVGGLWVFYMKRFDEGREG